MCCHLASTPTPLFSRAQQRAHVHLRAHVCASVCARVPVRAQVSMHMHTHIHTHKRTSAHAHTHTHSTHTHTHTYTHTHNTYTGEAGGHAACLFLQAARSLQHEYVSRHVPLASFPHACTRAHTRQTHGIAPMSTGDVYSGRWHSTGDVYSGRWQTCGSDDTRLGGSKSN